jgi:hypothetical protein
MKDENLSKESRLFNSSDFENHPELCFMCGEVGLIVQGSIANNDGKLVCYIHHYSKPEFHEAERKKFEEYKKSQPAGECRYLNLGSLMKEVSSLIREEIKAMQHDEKV